MKKRWRLAPIDEYRAKELASNLNISTTLASILAKKELSVEEARYFLYPETKPYHDPYLLKDMDKVVDRLLKAKQQQEAICIYGDYDVDGVTSTTLLMKVLSRLGFRVEYYLPDRHSEGYGLHVESLEKLVDKYSVIVTVDCGITAVKEVEFAQGKVDLIITDHHLPLDTLPPAYGIINPHQPNCNYPNKYLCGVGVAFKLCQALIEALGENPGILDDYLDIVALGTVADIVPLLDENRRLVKEGLSRINNAGIKEILNITETDVTKVNTGHIGFQVGPRLNAAGRLTHASAAVELLLATNPEEVREKAKFLDEENRARQQIVEDIFNEAVEMIEEQGLQHNKVIVVAQKDWHEGVIGIAASRLQERYYRPIVIIAIREDIGKASCRSIDGLHMKEALEACSEDLIIFGGHSKAAGFSILPEKIPEFTQHILAYAEEHMTPEDLIPILDVEKVLAPHEVTKEFIEELSHLEPFGMGNTKPQFACEKVRCKQAKAMGKEGTHLRFDFEAYNQIYTAIGWNMADYVEEINQHFVDLVFQPDINSWNGREYVQFKLNDLRLSEPGVGYLEAYPSYNAIAQVYVAIRKLQGNNSSINKSSLYISLERQQAKISNRSLDTALKILAELNLIRVDAQDNISLLPAPAQKLNLSNSPTYQLRGKTTLL